MNTRVIGAGILGTMLAVVPAFAGEPDQNELNQFGALAGIQAGQELSDAELGAIEGQGAPFLGVGQIGLVNATAVVSVRNVDIDVIRDVTVQDVNIAVLSAGRQQ